MGGIILLFGVLMLIPFVLVKSVLFYGIDTTELLDLMIGESAASQEELIARLVPFIFDKIFGNFAAMIISLVAIVGGFLLRKRYKKSSLDTRLSYKFRE